MIAVSLRSQARRIANKLRSRGALGGVLGVGPRRCLHSSNLNGVELSSSAATGNPASYQVIPFHWGRAYGSG